MLPNIHSSLLKGAKVKAAKSKKASEQSQEVSLRRRGVWPTSAPPSRTLTLPLSTIPQL